MSLNLGQVVINDDETSEHVAYVNVYHDKFVDGTIENRLVITDMDANGPLYRSLPLTKRECLRLAQMFLAVGLSEHW
jgi:hypothetical protein